MLEQLEEVSKPRIVDNVPNFPSDYAYAINKKQILEYHWEILFNGTLDENAYRHGSSCKLGSYGYLCAG